MEGVGQKFRLLDFISLSYVTLNRIIDSKIQSILKINSALTDACGPYNDYPFFEKTCIRSPLIQLDSSYYF